MASRQSSKRRRINQQGAYHDSIPLGNDLDTIHSTEGKLTRVCGNIRAAPMMRSPQPIIDSWEKLTAWTLPDDNEFALDPNFDLYNEALHGSVMEDSDSPAPEKKKRSKVSKRPHVVWKESHRQAYLDEVVRWSGRGDFCMTTTCPDCLARSSRDPGVPEFRCDDCFLPDLTCGSCCVRRHRVHPFHRIRKWMGSHFVKASLQSLGLKVQLNHGSMFCENPIPAHAAMLVLHTNGIHEVNIFYCGCTQAIPHHLQLLRRRLYPASQITPKTCATFELLEHLHKLALTTKASTYDFYRALEKSTNNTGIKIPKSRYRALFRMNLQWRHLQMLKWSGRRNDQLGVEGTQPGELGLVCPSCPHPGINLLEGWETAPEGLKFLYMVIICMDANFRLKNQIVSNYSQDPGLGIGWAYMVPRQPYEAYVLSRANDDDISTCVGFQALAKANTKFSVGLRYTGVNLTVCGRSEMIFPLGVGNLQKGERYANMDYIFGSVVRLISVTLVVISYDIACQWFINLAKRIEEHWPPEIKPPSHIRLTPAIPKLHESMHQSIGHQVYSFNYIPGVGETDGECPERVWGPHNALVNGTKTQGPGSRQDVLDDHFGFWNWLKYIGLGTTLLRRYKAAVAQRNLQQEGHRGLTDSLDEDLVNNWETICVDWEEDAFPKKKKNPYHLEDVYLSEAQVKKELADEEEEWLANGNISLHAILASSFIQMGLELEDSQRRLRRIAKAIKSGSTIGQETKVTEERNNFRTRFRAWEQLLPIYMPGLLQYQLDAARGPLSSQHAPKSAQPEDATLWLPSLLPANVRQRACHSGLPKIEERLRESQCADSLNKIRGILKVKSRMIHFKNKNLRGQHDGTRSRAVIDRVHMKARNAADKYRAAYDAKLALAGPGEWQETFQLLNDKDIRGYQDPNRLRPKVACRGVLDDDQVEMALQEKAPAPAYPAEDGEFELFNEIRGRRDGTGETKRTLSWIWTLHSGAPDDSKDDILRVEWAKSRARVKRSTEEVMLLKEEMRRVLAFLEWKADWWKLREESRQGISKELAEGVRSLAIDQSSLQQSLAAHFRALWKSPLQEPNTTMEGCAGNKDGDNNGDDEDDDDDDDEAVDDDDDDDSGPLKSTESGNLSEDED